MMKGEIRRFGDDGIIAVCRPDRPGDGLEGRFTQASSLGCNMAGFQPWGQVPLGRVVFEGFDGFGGLLGHIFI
jgi:hypothetical protein